MQWEDDTKLRYHRFHRHSRIKEISFNASKEHVPSQSQMKYLLDILRQNVSSKKKYNEQCLAAVPSTDTWIFIDCSIELQNISFLCEYTSLNKGISRLESAEQTYNETQFCNHGWHLMGNKCIRVARIDPDKHDVKNYTSLEKLDLICQHHGGKMFDAKELYESLTRLFKYFLTIFLKTGISLLDLVKKCYWFAL